MADRKDEPPVEVSVADGTAADQRVHDDDYDFTEADRIFIAETSGLIQRLLGPEAKEDHAWVKCCIKGTTLMVPVLARYHDYEGDHFGLLPVAVLVTGDLQGLLVPSPDLFDERAEGERDIGP